MFGDVVAGVDGHLFENRTGPPQDGARSHVGRRPRRRRPGGGDRRVRGDLPAGDGRGCRIPASSSIARWTRSFAPGTRRARERIAASTASPTTWERPSTSSRWCSGTWGTTRRPVSASPATPPPARRSCTASSWSNAQGEDVVSGVRTPQQLAELEAVMPEAFAALLEQMRGLEEHYREMQDIEFTIERGRCTSCRPGPASGRRPPPCGSRAR